MVRKLVLFFLVMIFNFQFADLTASETFPRLLWEKEIEGPVVGIAFGAGTAQTCVLTNDRLTLFSSQGDIIWEKPNLGVNNKVALSSDAETVLAWNTFTQEYRVINETRNLDKAASYTGQLLLAHYGNFIFTWKSNGDKISVLNTLGGKVYNLSAPGVTVLEVKVMPADKSVLVLGNEKGQRCLYYFSIDGFQVKNLPESLIVDSLDEVIISADGAYLGTKDAIYDFSAAKIVANTKAELVAFTSDIRGYFYLDKRRQLLSYAPIPGTTSRWEQRHILDQWQKVYVDPRNQNVITLSYLDSAIEYIVQIFDLNGMSRLIWRLDWNDNSRFFLTTDARFALVKQDNLLTMYQLF